MHLRHILVGTDFSQGASRALDRAAQLASSHGAALELVHVLPRMPARILTRLGVRLAFAKEAEARARAQLEEEARRAEESDVRVRTRLVRGGSWRALEEAATRSSPDLIVVGGRGERSGRSILLGSTAARLVERGSWTTLVVRRAARFPYSSILACVALGPASARVLETALSLSDHALVEALHVYDPPFEAKMRSYGASDEAITRHRHETKREATERFRALRQELPVPAGRLRTRLRRGRPVDVILRVAEEHELVVIGRRQSPVADMLLGSVAEELLRAVPCDVLVVSRSNAD